MTGKGFEQKLLCATTEAKREMSDILEDETHLPSQYIAMGLKQASWRLNLERNTIN